MNKKILILNDIEDEKKFFSRLLHEANYDVVITDNELSLLDLVNTQNPNVILLSSFVESKDTCLICKKIKLLEKGENIPIIFIQQDHLYLDGETLFNSGGSDYISYPFSSGEILHKVAQQIQIVDLAKDLQEKNNQLLKIIPHYQNLKQTLEKTKIELAKLTETSIIKLSFDREKFENHLGQEWLRASRQRAYFADLSGTSISLIISEINDFNLYQENHEPQVVINCLNIISANLSQTPKRPADIVAKLDNDRFAILLPNTDQQGAIKVAEIINKMLADLQIPHGFSPISDYLSMSFGIATGIPTQALPATVLVEVAESALEDALAKKRKEVIITDSF